MPNTLTGYDLLWFAQEALIQLERALGFGSRVHRGYTRTPQKKGNTIHIRRPSVFTAQDAPSSKQALSTEEVKVELAHWKEVKFALTDKELSGTPDMIIDEHISPAAFALADFVDLKFAQLYTKVPWSVDRDTTSPIKNLTRPRQILRDNGAPLQLGRIHYAVDSEEEATLLEQTFMHSADVAGTDGRQSLIEGTLGRRVGVDIFPNGNIQQHTSGTVISAGTDNAGALNGAVTKGATQAAVNGLSGTETLKVGDEFVIAGNTQRYVVTEDVAMSTGAGTVKFFPAAVQAYTDASVVTFEAGASTNADAYHANLYFHRNFAALATAPLQSDIGSQIARAQGIEVETVTNEESSLTLRAMRWYDPDLKEVVTALDLLFGFEILDPNLAVKVRRDV